MNLRIYLIYENKEDINLLRNSKLRVSGRAGEDGTDFVCEMGWN